MPFDFAPTPARQARKARGLQNYLAGHAAEASVARLYEGRGIAICALTLSGLPSDRFFFAGFPPSAQGARRSFLADLAGVQATLILYESPKRLAALLAEMAEVLGADRQAVVCRELTKRFEEVLRGSLATLAAEVETRDTKGEIVVLVDRAAPIQATEASIGTALEAALKSMSVKDAATFVSQTLGVSRKIVYRIALDRSQE